MVITGSFAFFQALEFHLNVFKLFQKPVHFVLELVDVAETISWTV
jgi:hypothetical protein